jgi:integrase/recombinase XerD
MAEPPVLVAETIEQYLLMLTVVDGRSPLTITSYESDLKSLLEHLGSEDALLGVSGTKLDTYFAQLRSMGRKPSTVARAMSSCRGFYRFLLDEHLVEVDPSTRLPVPGRAQSLPKALPETTIAALINGIQGRSALDTRDRMIIEFLYGTGARVTEMLGAEVQDVDLDEMLIRLMGKGSKQRLVPIGRQLAEALREYLGSDGRKQLATVQSKSRLLLNSRGNPLSRHGVNEILLRRAKASGIEAAGLHAHAFRHSCATHMIAHGADIRVVQELLGHSSIATTQRYTGVALTTLRTAYESSHPRASGLS